MDALENLMTRRSIRRFSGEPVSEADAAVLFRAAMAAPSAGNAQPWHFVKITDRAILSQLPDIQPHTRMMAEAAFAILVCADVTLEKHEGFWVQDCSAAAMNILLAAHALGLGAVWCGLHPRIAWAEGLSRLINLPHHIRPLCLVAVGHPAERKEPSERFKSERIHLDRW
ncbi:nitroreductase family protein [Oleispirillum naphthae]|uniref:nitroreductase family protein n=1 Tax=Oleispirillum naphthae TaxID=2838853 RepID=UPI003082539E